MERQSRADGRTIPREEDAPRALIVLMIILMLGSVAALLVWIQAAGIADDVIGRPAGLASEGPIHTVEEILEEPAKANLLGREVAIPRAQVEEVIGDWHFWVGPDSGNVVPVVLMGEQTARQRELQTVVRDGDTVAIFGFIRAVHDVSFLDEPWSMDSADWERLIRAGIYISAFRVEHLEGAAR